jgi:hypothetical protein
VAKEILGISLEWTSFADLDTSAGPSVSLTIDGYSKGFSHKLSDIGLQSGDKIQLWIKILWRDGTKEDATPSTDKLYLALRYRSCYDLSTSSGRSGRPPRDRAQETVARKEDLIQAMIWSSAAGLKAAAQPNP